jgi:hypothetical protein
MPIIISGSNGISGVDGTAAAPAVQGADNNTGVFFPAADTIAFSEGGTESLRLNAAGNAVFAGTIQTAGITTSLYPLVQGTAVASTSGTSIDFTGIPSWVRRVTVMLNNVSTNGTSNLLAQIGSGSVVTSGYTAAGFSIEGTNATGTAVSTAGFLLARGSVVAAVSTLSGHMVLTNLSGNIWVQSGMLGRTDLNGFGSMGAGSITLAGALDRVRITTVGGTDLFDAGTVNILWE